MIGFKYNIILASNSPRRKDLLSGLGFNYKSIVIPNIDESYPLDLEKELVAQHLAEKKSKSYTEYLTDNNLLITADTTVILNGEIYGKPKNEEDAVFMLKKLSANTHQVVTGVCLSTANNQKSFSVKTDVTFRPLSDSEIDYYVTEYKPLDKAGAYGIQEWIGYIGVEHLSGSYFNVMGLPVQELYSALINL